MAMNEKSRLLTDDGEMLDDYSHLTGWIKNPYTKNVYREKTLIINEEIIKKFEILADEKGLNRDELMKDALIDYLTNNRPQL